MAKTDGKRSYEPPALKVFGSVQMMTQGTGPENGDSGMGKMPAGMMSDPHAKVNIVEVGRHPLGFGLYLFDYRPEFAAGRETGRQFGVMADEVERVVPGAVSVGKDGYRRVDYDLLGIRRGH